MRITLDRWQRSNAMNVLPWQEALVIITVALVAVSLLMWPPR
jgi:hypothetical protein